MIQTITVEREYASGGVEFARLLAEHLKWELVDHSLIQEVARRANVSPDAAERRDEQLDPWYNKMGRAFWHGSNERATAAIEREIFDATRMTELMQAVMRDKAKAGKCVIVGRGAACALHAIPGCFHVFVYASMARKIKMFEELFPSKAHVAEKELLATDRRRAEYIQHFYNADWMDHHIYHLMLNSCMGYDAMIGATTEAAGI
jgi:Cytidylate kinase-like family